MCPAGARQGDSVAGTDIHIVMIPTPAGQVPTPLPHPFGAKIGGATSLNVSYDGKPAAMVNSVTNNSPAHIPQGGTFQAAPSNQGKIMMGSATVFVNGKQAARQGDKVLTCNDPAPLPAGTIVAGSPTVIIG